MCPNFCLNDEQAIRMLQSMVGGTPNLVQVLNLCHQTKKAAGQSIKISLNEHVALLAQQAQVHDNVKTHICCDCRRSAAAHDLTTDRKTRM